MPKRLRGMQDILPGSAGGSSELWQMMEEGSRDVFSRSGYREIRTPILEEKALFVKSIGSDTDIVTKEMFAFQDRGERDVALRPEGTAPIVRAYLEANLHKTDPFQKFYYIGPMFRAERPQAGRMRQFHQVGAEAIGSLSPAIDAEIIILLAAILDKAKIKGCAIRLNNLGCREDKARLSKKLRETLSEKKALLCDDCKKRLAANPLRVLDCKNETCRSAVHGTMKSADFLCEKCVEHFDKVKAHLDDAKVAYAIDPYIVRGLDYYTSTVFEVSHPALGAQDAIGAGGRYDNLISDMGGPQIGAVGFALGVERMLMVMTKQGATRFPEEGLPPLLAYIATIGDEAHRKGFEVASELRRAGISCGMDYEGKSLKAQMRQADSKAARFVVIIGEDELAKDEAQVRDMRTKEQAAVKIADLSNVLKAKT